MKAIYLFSVVALLALSPAASAKKEPPITPEERTVVQVYQAEGLTKDQIYDTARQWIAESFKSAKAVTEYESKEEGTIIGNGSIKYPCKGGFSCMAKADWRVTFTMKVEAKDGRFRATFTNIRMTWPASYSSGIATPAGDFEPYFRRNLDEIKPQLLLLGAELQARMGKAAQSDDW